MILALETSCDETAAALFDPARGLAHEWVHSQIALHGRYGGVVPDLATREHLRAIAPLLGRAKDASGNFARVTSVAVTHGPGLAGCLAIGVAAAKSLALALRVPLAGVNHLRGHAFSPFIALHAAAPEKFSENFPALLPHLGLIVSGGNTLLFRIDPDRAIRVLSTTRDDAAGEALDKGAKLLGLGYPGGPLIEKLAATPGAKSDAFDFPRGIGPRADLDFSFSGLKTALRYTLEKMAPAEVAARMPDLCASYQQAVIDALVRKTTNALSQQHAGAPAQQNESGNAQRGGARPGKTDSPAKAGHSALQPFGPSALCYASLGLSGGVANNRPLRAALERLAKNRRLPLLMAEPRHTGDNAGMIAFAAWVDPHAKPAAHCADLRIEPGLELTPLP